jgi:hypothetical protein
LDLKIIVMIFRFGHQNQAGYGLGLKTTGSSFPVWASKLAATI